MKRLILFSILLAFLSGLKAVNPNPVRSEGTHWSFDPYSQYSLSLTGELFLNGVSMRNSPRATYLEIGVFCGDDCRGSFFPDYVPLPFFQGYAYQMQIYSNVQSGEQMTFRVWDHETNQLLNVMCQETIGFVDGQIIGDLQNPMQLHFVTSTSTSFEITAISSPMDGGVVTGAGSYPQNGTCTLMAAANPGFTFDGWMENGAVVSTCPSYQFTVSSSRILVANFSGNPEVVVYLQPGWTWVSYTLFEEKSIESALGSFAPVEGDLIKSQRAFCSFINGHWVGSLKKFTPGVGYMYYSNRTNSVPFWFSANPVIQ